VTARAGFCLEAHSRLRASARGECSRRITAPHARKLFKEVAARLLAGADPFAGPQMGARVGPMALLASRSRSRDRLEIGTVVGGSQGPQLEPVPALFPPASP